MGLAILDAPPSSENESTDSGAMNPRIYSLRREGTGKEELFWSHCTPCAEAPPRSGHCLHCHTDGGLTTGLTTDGMVPIRQSTAVGRRLDRSSIAAPCRHCDPEEPLHSCSWDPRNCLGCCPFQDLALELFISSVSFSHLSSTFLV